MKQFTKALARLFLHRDVQLACLCGLVLILAQSTIISIRHFDGVREHLGGEYGNIARALVRGRGFSDPFGEPTGPTAWMPPILPMTIAVLFRLLNQASLVGLVFSWLSIALLSATGAIIARVARESATRLPDIVAVGLYLVWIILFNYYFIILTHDVSAITFLVALIVWNVQKSTNHVPLSPYRWGVLGGVTSLASPATAFTWGTISLLLSYKRRLNRARLIAALGIAFAVSVPWLIRNGVVFHELIPCKSNLYYDLYVANYVDDDGLWDYRSMTIHPYLSMQERASYSDLGEREYVSAHKHSFVSRVKSSPKRFVSNILRRILAVSVQYVPTDTEADGPFERRFKSVLQPLVFICALAGIGLKNPNQHAARILSVVWVAFTLPYVIIGFHIRHVLPASIVLLLLAYWGFDAVITRKWNKEVEVERQGVV
jgi:hypothetical protein